MKNHLIFALLVGLLVGGLAGYFFSGLRGRSATARSSTLLREFSLTTLLGKTDQAKWQVLEDKIYDPFPAAARCKRAARRIIARSADLPAAELERFTKEFQQSASAALDSFHAVTKGQFDLSNDSTRVVGDSPSRYHLEFPRRYYSIGDIHGVADIWSLAESGSATVIVSLIEGS